jgi:hypothetical protein
MYKFYGQSEQDKFIFERYFQNKENYEQCIEIRNLIQKIKNKKLSSKVSKKEKLILMKLSPVMKEE